MRTKQKVAYLVRTDERIHVVSEEFRNQLIDVALITNDKEWFNQISEMERVTIKNCLNCGDEHFRFGKWCGDCEDDEPF